MKNIQAVKQRFGIIGNHPLLERAIDVCMQVAPTNLSVLILGESGTGKEVMPKVIHQLSSRKHNQYIAVNCGAIPEGTIDSELFGHEKGAFTGAHSSRKGYFETANGGTIFLDEVAELPIQTQVRLLRVLETGEFIRVGSSNVIKTDVRVVAATNVNVTEAIKKGKFREDLYYRLNQVPVVIPPLRERKEDVLLLFRKFTADFSEKYHIPMLQLNDEAQELLLNYPWPGNIRQMKNIAEQISILEENRNVTAETLIHYLPQDGVSSTPMVVSKGSPEDLNEREILYKVLFDMKNDLNDVKKLVMSLLNGGGLEMNETTIDLVKKVFHEDPADKSGWTEPSRVDVVKLPHSSAEGDVHTIDIEESLSLADKEKEMIKKALDKHGNKRKYAARELGISERTLYRKIKEYNLK